MSPETARTILFAIAIPLGFVWVAGIRFAWRRLRGGPEARDDGLLPGGDDDREEVWIGEGTVPGEPPEVSRRLAELIVSRPLFAGAGFCRIVERGPDRLRVEGLPAPTRGRGFRFDEAELELRRDGERTRVTYRVRATRILRLLRILLLVFGVGAGGLFVVGAPLLVWFLVLPSEEPAVRVQVLQTLQMVHGVWPPFLFGGLATKIRDGSMAYFDALISAAERTAPEPGA